MKSNLTHSLTWMASFFFIREDIKKELPIKAFLSGNNRSLSLNVTYALTEIYCNTYPQLSTKCIFLFFPLGKIDCPLS